MGGSEFYDPNLTRPVIKIFFGNPTHQALKIDSTQRVELRVELGWFNFGSTPLIKRDITL